MKQTGILNRDLSAVIAALGHTQSIVIGDCGLPIPDGVPVIDLALVPGTPSFLLTLRAVLGELVTERAVIASEMPEKNPAVYAQTARLLDGIACRQCPHEDFKRLTEQARCVIRTGECTPYSNVILYGGVNF